MKIYVFIEDFSNTFDLSKSLHDFYAYFATFSNLLFLGGQPLPKLD